MQQWNVELRVFAVEQFYRNNDSVVTVQRIFRRQFNVAREEAIPEYGSDTRKESVRRSVIESPRPSTRRRASVVGLSRRSLQCILHGELNFHPYKIMIVQKLLPSDFVQRRLFCERMLEIIASDDVILMLSNEAYFHLDGYVNKQNCRFGLQRTRESYTRDLSILLRFQFGAAFRKWGSLVLTLLKKKGLQ